VRGFNKVRGEWSLMALCYNFSRVLSIVGLDDLVAYFAKRAADLSFLRPSIALTAAMDRVIAFLAQFWIAFRPKSAVRHLHWYLAA
jgi:hypothetical protein